MGATKEYLLKMPQEVFETELSPLQRSMFTYCKLIEINEYETHKDDPNYIKLHKAERKARNAKEEYLFNKRHGGNT
jgi:hypothetical protein